MKLEYESIVIGAHPDDPFLGAGGTIAKYSSDGRRVLVVCATNGSNGDTHEIGSVRENEFFSAIDYLGVEGFILHFEDGTLPFNIREMYMSFLQLFLEYNPKMIFFHHKSDSNPDHVAVHDAVCLAISTLWHRLKERTRLIGAYQYVPVKLGAFSLKDLNIVAYCDISRYTALKRASILAHVSQQPYVGQNLQVHEKFSEFMGAILLTDAIECFSTENNAYQKLLQRLE